MNFLGHLWLADRTRTSLAGSILGDVVRGRDLSAFPDGIAQGIRLHRLADAHIDRHPVYVEARRTFQPGLRRFAGVVLDIALDHALATGWERFHDTALDTFARNCGQVLEAHAEWFEFAGGTRPRAGVFAQLLQSYADPAGIDKAFARVAARSRRGQVLVDAARDWPEHAERLRAHLPTLLEAMRSLAPDSA